MNHNYLKTKSLLKTYNKDPVFGTISCTPLHPFFFGSQLFLPAENSICWGHVGWRLWVWVQVTTFLLQMTDLWECFYWVRLEIFFWGGEGQLMI